MSKKGNSYRALAAQHEKAAKAILDNRDHSDKQLEAIIAVSGNIKATILGAFADVFDELEKIQTAGEPDGRTARQQMNHRIRMAAADINNPDALNEVLQEYIDNFAS